MKKVFIVLAICLSLCILAYFMWANPQVGENIGNSISDFFDNVFEGKYVEYNSDFKINSLGIKDNDYYFKTLTDDQKKMYTAVAIATKKLENVAKIKKYVNNVDDIIVSDASVAMEAFFADHPEIFYVDMEYELFTIKSVLGKQIEIKLKYTSDDKKVIKEQIKTLENKVNEIIKGLKSETDIDKEIELHDILCNSIEYYSYADINSIPTDKHTVYGALIKNSAVCDGISKAMQILLDKCNIESILIVGKIDELHAWNMVKIEDEWYNLDLTSDKSVKSNEKYVVHSYFNVTTDNILKTHTMGNLANIPSAISDKYNYYIYKDLNIKSTDDFSAKLNNIISRNSDSKILEFSVDKNVSDVPDKMITVMQKNKNNEYLTENLTKVSYYNILNSYIVKKVL